MPQSWFLGSRAGKSCKFRGRGQQRDFIVRTRVGEVGGYVKPTMFRLIDRDLCSSACALDIYICGCVRSVNLNGVRACVSGYLLNEADCKDRDSVVFIHISRYSTEWHTGRHAGWETTLAERAGGHSFEGKVHPEKILKKASWLLHGPEDQMQIWFKWRNDWLQLFFWHVLQNQTMPARLKEVKLSKILQETRQ